MKTNNPGQHSTGQIQVVNQGDTTSIKLQSLLSNLLGDLTYGNPDSKLPTTVTCGDNWLCIASIVGDVCLSINFTEIGRAAL